VASEHQSAEERNETKVRGVEMLVYSIGGTGHRDSVLGRALAGLAGAVFLASFSGPPANAQVSGQTECNAACLTEIAETYMKAIGARGVPNLPSGANPVYYTDPIDVSSIPWGPRVFFTEDQVSMMIGDGLWGSLTAYGEDATIIADEVTGNVAWFGWVEEHGQPAYYAMRMRVENARVTEVETVVARREEPGLYSDDVKNRASFPDLMETVPVEARSSRERLIDIAHGYLSTLQQNDGTLLADFSADCTWYENGANVVDEVPDLAGQGCRRLFEIGYFKPIDRVRDRAFPVVDEERGLVVAVSTRDRNNQSLTWRTNDGVERQNDDVIYYSHSRGAIELLKIEGGEITAIRTISNFLPYYMPSPWQQRALGLDVD
jgi:hypothetical protein